MCVLIQNYTKLPPTQNKSKHNLGREFTKYGIKYYNNYWSDRMRKKGHEL